MFGEWAKLIRPFEEKVGKVYRKKFRGTNDDLSKEFNLVSNFWEIVAKSSIHFSNPSRWWKKRRMNWMRSSIKLWHLREKLRGRRND